MPANLGSYPRFRDPLQKPRRVCQHVSPERDQQPVLAARRRELRLLPFWREARVDRPTTQTVAAPKLPAVVMPPCVVMAVIRSGCGVAVAVIRRIAIAVIGRIPVTVIGPIAVAISVIGPCERASDE